MLRVYLGRAERSREKVGKRARYPGMYLQNHHIIYILLNMLIYIVLLNIYYHCSLPLSKCIQYEEKDEGSIRPSGFEPLLVFVDLFPVLFRLRLSFRDSR